MTSYKVSDFRPIACSNVLYNCFGKNITNKLKGALVKLVDDNQSAFIPGSKISDSILITQELMKVYDWNSDLRKCAFKIDIQKAYDTVNWEYLGNIVDHFGYSSKDDQMNYELYYYVCILYLCEWGNLWILLRGEGVETRRSNVILS